MSVEKVIVGLVVGIFQGLSNSYMIFNQINGMEKTNKIKFTIIMCIYCFIGFLFIPNNIRFLVFLLVIFLNSYFVLNIRDKNVILYAFNAGLILVIAELVISLVLVIIGLNSVEIVENNLYNLLANVLISIFSIVLIKLPFIKKIIKKEINIFIKNKNLTLLGININTIKQYKHIIAINFNIFFLSSTFI